MLTSTTILCGALLLITMAAWCTGRPATNDAESGNATANGSQPANFQDIIIEVSPGETAVLHCPSNDERHRFQYWWMKAGQYVGPGSPISSDKFKYEVLTGTLYIKRVTPEESGVYTCVCKNIEDISMLAKSVQLDIKGEWQDLWANDYTVNSIRVAAVLSVLVLILLLLYLFYLTAYKTGNRTLHFREDYSDEDVSTDRQMYRKTNNIMKENMFQHGIDNPTLEKDVSEIKKNESKA